MSLASFEGHTKSYEQDCFAGHIRESIGINRARKPVYHKLTNGRSDKIFNFLITSEKVSLLFGSYFDWRAKSYQKKGVPLFCYEFMSMDATPSFDPERREIPKEEFLPFDWKSYRNRISRALKDKDTKKIKDISLEAIRALDAFPSYYCMSRHMFESIYRFAYFLPLQEDRSLKAGLKSPRSLSLKMIKLHNLSLVSSYKIDQWSAPIQKEGIPILCSELPRLLDDLDVGN